MEVYVGFTMGRKSWISKFILWGTRAKVDISHSLFMLDILYFSGSDLKRRFTVGAEGDGVRWIPAKTFDKKNELKALYEVIVDHQMLEDSLVWMEETYSEQPYDAAGAIAIGVKNRLRFLWRWIGRWWRSHLSKNAIICTELVLRTLQRMGLLLELDPELTEAPKLLQAVNGQKGRFKLIYATDDVRAFLG